MSEEIAQTFHPKPKLTLELVEELEFKIKHQAKTKTLM